MKMKNSNAHPEDFAFILKSTRQNMEGLVTEEWNADWEKDVEPKIVNLWKTQGEKKFRKITVMRVNFLEGMDLDSLGKQKVVS